MLRLSVARVLGIVLCLQTEVREEAVHNLKERRGVINLEMRSVQILEQRYQSRFEKWASVLQQITTIIWLM